MKPVVSTVLLNWNRAHLLQRTVKSYLATITVPYELVIVDNNSEDGSRDYIDSIPSNSGKHRAILLEENIGGEAINLGWQGAAGRFLHLSSNDMEYLPKWDLKMLAKFEVFPELGQLSFFSPFPLVEMGEVWETHSGELIERSGQRIYVTKENIGGGSLMRRELWDSGVRWHNMPGTNFPHDGITARQIHAQGAWIAWNDEYVALNIGHFIDELMSNAVYYQHNYQSKDWLGVEGFRKRLQASGYDLIEADGKPKIVKIA